MKKLMAIVLAAALAVSLCSCGSASSAAASSAAPASSAAASSASSTAGGPATDPNYKMRTSDSERVVTENGTFGKDQIKTPVLVTSVGQSADVSMLDALMKKIGAEYTFNATATAEDVAAAGTVIVASGASSKGLGAAGISVDAEAARAADILKAAKDNGVTVIMAHLGGAARRGSLSDQFNDLVLQDAAYIIVVEDGNTDGKFTDYASEHNVPITLVKSIADAVTPLTDLFA